MHPALWTALACAWLAFARAGDAVSLGQVDDFESGSVQGWVVGSPHPAPPANVASGGPAGADDDYLRLTSIGGFGAGSRLAAFNVSQWTGSFSAAGVTGIAMDVINLGSTSLTLRVALDGAGQTAISTVAISLPSGSGWTPIVFPIAPADLTALQGTVAGVLASVTEMRLLHGSAVDYPGEPIVAGLGVDNIRAVPEPSTLALVGLGALALLRARPSRR